MSELKSARPKPLGIFGPTRERGMQLNAEELTELRDGLDQDLRECVSHYLRSGAVIIPLMSYTTDVLEGRFGVSGGSGIISDGHFYWRLDAAEYVKNYGIAVEDQALEHMRRNKWNATALTVEEISEIDSYLAHEIR